MTSSSCPICYELLPPTKETKLLECDHEFCEACLVAWVKNSTSCPLCRNVVTRFSVEGREYMVEKQRGRNVIIRVELPEIPETIVSQVNCIICGTKDPKHLYVCAGLCGRGLHSHCSLMEEETQVRLKGYFCTQCRQLKREKQINSPLKLSDVLPPSLSETNGKQVVSAMREDHELLMDFYSSVNHPVSTSLKTSQFEITDKSIQSLVRSLRGTIGLKTEKEALRKLCWVVFSEKRKKLLEVGFLHIARSLLEQSESVFTVTVIMKCIAGLLCEGGVNEKYIKESKILRTLLNCLNRFALQDDELKNQILQVISNASSNSEQSKISERGVSSIKNKKTASSSSSSSSPLTNNNNNKTIKRMKPS